MSNFTPRARAAATSGISFPLAAKMSFGGGAVMWVTMSPRFIMFSSLPTGE